VERKETTEISHLLSLGFLCDRVLFAFDVAGPQGAADRDRDALERLTEIFEGVCEITERPTSILLNQGRFGLVAAPSIAIDLFTEFHMAGDAEPAISGLRDLRDTLRFVREGKEAGPEAVAVLRTFLERMADASLTEVHTRRQRTESGRREDPRPFAWQKT